MSDPTVAEAWVAAPLRRLMEEARLISGVLLYPTGRAVGQFGFSFGDVTRTVLEIRQSKLPLVGDPLLARARGDDADECSF